jgi:surface protein
MENMFYDNQAATLDLSNFDTSNVTNMYAMFYGSQADALDLSTFDTSNVSNTNSMFTGSSAVIGYARTQADVDKFNSSTSIPKDLTFVIKP